MEHTRTTREPKQAIPTFAETIELLMREENRHVKFNVSDVFQPFFLGRLVLLAPGGLVSRPGSQPHYA